MDLHLPQNETEAEWMQKAGYRWIADNAPHKLTDLSQELTEANKTIVALSEALVKAEQALRDAHKFMGRGYIGSHTELFERVIETAHSARQALSNAKGGSDE